MMKWVQLSLLLFLTAFAFAQKPAHLVRPSDTLDPDPFVNTVQQDRKRAAEALALINSSENSPKGNCK
jgi:hypothetical protein